MMRQILALITVVTVAGCSGARATYVRSTAAANELVWDYDSGLEVSQNGQTVSWGDLPEAVICVPAALRHAETANSASTAQGWLLGTGLAVFVGGTTFSAVQLAEDIDDNLVTSLSVFGGSFLLSMILLGISNGQGAKVMPNRIDAVNVYNDSFAANPACR